MSLNDDVKKLAFDKRLIDWNLKYGVITESEVHAFLKSLEDSSANALQVDLEDREDFIDSQKH
jgi:hypothetical protein